MPETTWVASSTAVEAPRKAELALNWIKKNRETVIGSAVVLLAVAVFGVYVFMHYRDLRETAWTNLFKAQQIGYGGNQPQALEMLSAIETTYGNTSAAPFAIMTKGDLLFAQGKFKEAGVEYAKIAAGSGDMAPLAVYSQGKCKEAEGDLAGAQASYSDILARFPDHFITPEAHYSLARSQDLAGAKDLAKAAYEKVVLLYPDTSWAEQAKAKLTGGAAQPKK